MPKPLTLLIGIVIVIVASLLLYNLKDSYKLLPVNENQPDLTTENAPFKIRDWRQFSPPEKEFRVLLPALPQHAIDTIPDPKTNELRKYETFVSADDDGKAYMISAITFPNELTDDQLENTLQSVIDDMLARNKDNKLHSKEFGLVGDRKSLDFTIANGETFIAGKMFSQGNIVYVLSVLTNKGQYDPKDLDYFVNSFKIAKTIQQDKNTKK